MYFSEFCGSNFPSAFCVLYSALISSGAFSCGHPVFLFIFLRYFFIRPFEVVRHFLLCTAKIFMNTWDDDDRRIILIFLKYCSDNHLKSRLIRFKYFSHFSSNFLAVKMIILCYRCMWISWLYSTGVGVMVVFGVIVVLFKYCRPQSLPSFRFIRRNNFPFRRYVTTCNNNVN